jgi:hypothetical protein
MSRGTAEYMVGSRHDPLAAKTLRAEDAPPLTLVHAFEGLLQTAKELPPIVLVPTTRRRRGFRKYVHSIPRPRLALRFFIADHARMTLDRVRRRMLAAAALGNATSEDEEERTSVTQYLESLSVRNRALYSTSLVLLTIVLTRVVLLAVPDAVRLFGGMGLENQVSQIDKLLMEISRTSSNLASLEDLVRALQTAPLRTVAFVGTSLTTVVYVELRLLVPSYRLKRTMFNLYPQQQRVASTPTRWAVQRAIGVYDLERNVLRRLGDAAKHEAPFDLIVPAMLMPSVLFLGWMSIDAGRQSIQPGDPLLSYTVGSAIVIGAVARLAWLTRAWLRRIGPDAGPYLPTEVRVRGTPLVVTLREPQTIFWTTAVFGVICIGTAIAAADGRSLQALQNVRFLVLAFVIAPLWYRMNRDLSAFLAARGARRPGRPLLSLLAMALGWLGQLPQAYPFATIATPRAWIMTAMVLISTGWVLTSVFNMCRRVQRAAALARPDDRGVLHPPLVVAGFVVFPWALAHIQGEMNTVWARVGDGLD